MRFDERRLNLVWLVLVVVTVSGFTIAEASLTRMLSIAVVMVLSGVKARLVLYEFMELHEAPIGFRVFFNVWLGFVVLMIISLNWAA